MKFLLPLVAALGLASPLAAQTATLTAGSSGYSPLGGQLTLTHTVTYTGLAPSAYALSVQLPAGWTFLSQNLPAGLAAAAGPAVGAGGDPLEWAFSAFPANTFTLTFTVAYPAGLTGNQVVTVPTAQYRSPTTNLTVAAITLVPALPPSITTQPASRTVTVGETVTLTAAADGAPTPTLRWKKGGVALSDGGRVSGSGTASLTLTGVLTADAGSYTLTASNSSGPDAVSNAAVLTVNKAPQTITFAPPTTKTFGDAAFTISATSSSGLTVSFASSNSTVATVSGNTVNVVGAGTTTLSATQAGNADYLPGEATQVLTVAKAPQTITFAALTPRTTGDGSLTLGASASSGLPVSYASANSAVATVSGSVITLAGGGSTVITAAQAGSANYLAATPVDQTLRVFDVRASQAVVGVGYFAGGSVTITNTLTYSGTPASFGWEVILPDGWSYAAGAGSEGDVKPAAGTVSLLEWAWTTLPPSPVTFTYTLNVPASSTGDKPLSSLVVYREGGGVVQLLGKPSPLNVIQVTTHTGDVDRNFRISLLELTRVIELYNTRNGGSRTGCYKVDPTGEDGFNPEPTRSASAVVTLAAYHAADTNRDGKIGLLELTRVIELYNYRPPGGGRTGQYHAEPGTEDGFAPGP
jgi:hypothetical protein